MWIKAPHLSHTSTGRHLDFKMIPGDDAMQKTGVAGFCLDTITSLLTALKNTGLLPVPYISCTWSVLQDEVYCFSPMRHDFK